MLWFLLFFLRTSLYLNFASVFVFKVFFVLILYLLQSSAVCHEVSLLLKLSLFVVMTLLSLIEIDFSTGSKKHLNYNVNSPYSVIICLFNLMLHVVSNCVITCFFFCAPHEWFFVLFCRNYEGSSDLKVCNWGATCHPGFEHVKCSELLKCWLDQM